MFFALTVHSNDSVNVIKRLHVVDSLSVTVLYLLYRENDALTNFLKDFDIWAITSLSLWSILKDTSNNVHSTVN